MRPRRLLPMVFALSFSACSPDRPGESESIFSEVPLDSIVRASLSEAGMPGATGSWGGGATVSPGAGVRHAQYEGTFDLLPEARAGLQDRLCDAIEADLRQRGRVQGTGRSGNICSVHMTEGGRHGWIDAVVWIEEQSGRAHVAVVLSDW